MQEFIEAYKDTIYFKIAVSLIVIIVAIILYKIILHIFAKSEKIYTKGDQIKKKRATYFNLFRSILRYVLIIVTALAILEINGVKITSLFAGIGILSIVIGLAVQDLLQDIIRGSSLVSDNYFAVGDVVKYGDIEGKVLIIGLKTTKIQDIRTNNVISIANRKIDEVEVVSDKIYVEIPMPYELSVETSEKIVKQIIDEIKRDEKVKDCIYKSINKLDSSSINYYIEVDCNPIDKLQVRRDSLRTALIIMEKNKVSVPYTQIDIHKK